MSIREARHPTVGPARVAVEIVTGRVAVTLDEAGADPGEVVVSVAHAPGSAPGWVDGLSDVLGWLDRRFGVATVTDQRGRTPAGDDETADTERGARAVAATAVAWDADARTLTVRAPHDGDLRTVPLLVTVRAPDSSAVRVRAGAAPVTVTGRVGDLDLAGTGPVTVDTVTGSADVRCGAGDVRLSRSTGRLVVSGGAGTIEVGVVSGPTEIRAGAGSVHLHEVRADCAVRLAGGDVTVDDASAGDLELTTGSGSMRVGVHAGVDARVDLRTGAGRATSELPVRTAAPATTPPLRIRGRAAAGDATVVAAS